MWQLFAVFIAFLAIPILLKFKIKLSYVLIITALFLGIISGIGMQKLFLSLTNVFTDIASLNTILTVMMVGILGGVMKQYGFLDKIVESLQKLIRNRKNILMIIPAMIGVLQIPGGAMLSAPFVNDIGKDLGIKRTKRAAINLIFRHISMFFLPYSIHLLIIISTFPQLELSKLVLQNSGIIASMIIIGYFLYLREAKEVKAEVRKDAEKNLLNLAIYTMPIYISVIINVITGWPFYITLIASVIVVYIIGDKKDFLKVVLKSINGHIVLTITAVMLMKFVILNMDQLLELFDSLFSGTDNFFSILLVLFSSGLFFGMITGNNAPPLAIMLPMIARLNPSIEMLYVYTYFAGAASFLGYYFSPLHLCQIFTLDIVGVTTGELYNEYRLYAVLMLIALFGTTYMVKWIWL